VSKEGGFGSLLFFLYLYCPLNKEIMKKVLLTVLLSIIVIGQPMQSRLEIDQFSVFSALTFKRLLYIMEIEHPEIVFIQAQIESGNFTSPIFKEGNNLFGMKVAEKRNTSAIGTIRGHAAYLIWKHSVIDYKLMQDKYAKGKSQKEYLKYLEKYAEDPNYITKIKRRL
jgi:hypothetical protein